MERTYRSRHYTDKSGHINEVAIADAAKRFYELDKKSDRPFQDCLRRARTLANSEKQEFDADPALAAINAFDTAWAQISSESYHDSFTRHLAITALHEGRPAYLSRLAKTQTGAMNAVAGRITEEANVGNLTREIAHRSRNLHHMHPVQLEHFLEAVGALVPLNAAAVIELAALRRAFIDTSALQAAE